MTEKEEFIDICKDKIHRDGIDELLSWLEKKDFFSAPASTRFHGSYEGGLCHHSLTVYKELVRFNDTYRCYYSDETLAIVGLFHDLCKIGVYRLVPKNVKGADGKWRETTVWEFADSAPLGHGEKSCLILQRFIRPTLEELLAIRWHMGGYDRSVIGGDRGASDAASNCQLVSLLQIADMAASYLAEDRTQEN